VVSHIKGKIHSGGHTLSSPKKRAPTLFHIKNPPSGVFKKPPPPKIFGGPPRWGKNPFSKNGGGYKNFVKKTF